MGYLDFYKLTEKEKLTLIGGAAYDSGFDDNIIEKDWWVVRTLDVIFRSSIGNSLIFKGGTSLSKAWGILQRFSEDIDLGMDRSILGFNKDNPTTKEIKKLRKAFKDYIRNVLYPTLQPLFIESGLDHVKMNLLDHDAQNDPMKIEIHYPSVVETNSDYIQPRVLLEIGVRSLMEPYESKPISSVLSQEYPDHIIAEDPINIPTVRPERTFLEKLFLLHEKFQENESRVDRQSRHLYDIHYIFTYTDFWKEAIENKNLYQTIVEFRRRFTKISEIDYDKHYPPYFNPNVPATHLELWKTDYGKTKEMIYGDKPDFEELITALQSITEMINKQ